MSKPLYRKVAGATEAAILALGPAAWFKPGVGVTGTLTASNWADQSGNGRDLAQGTAGNQPIYLPYSGTPYAYLPGVSGNNFSTPDAVGLTPASNIVGFVVRCAADDWTPASGNAGVMIAKADGGGENSYGFRIYPVADAKFTAYVSYDGTTNVFTSSDAHTLTDATWYWVAAVVDATAGTCKYYTAADTGSNETLPSSWTQLGSTITGLTTGTIKDSTSLLRVGRDDPANFFGGKMGRAIVYDGIPPTLGGAGAAMADWNPSTFAETSTNGTTATAATGEVWTLNSTGAKPATVVKSPQLLGDGTNHKMATSNFTLDQPFTDYIVARQITWTSGDFLSSGTAGAAGITQRTGTPKIGLDAGSGAADNADATLGTKCVITAVFNGASSSLQVNNGTATTGNPGAGNPGGLSLFSDNAGANYGNAIVWERIVFSAAHDATTRLLVQQYLSARHGISL